MAKSAQHSEHSAAILYFMVVLLVYGLLFLKSGVEKLTSGDFVSTLPKTLGYFASQNPYPQMKAFLLLSAMPDARTIGMLVMFGETLAGLAITAAVISFFIQHRLSPLMRITMGIGLIVAAFLNSIFWFSAAWTSPSTDSLNLLMLGVALVGFVFVLRENPGIN